MTDKLDVDTRAAELERPQVTIRGRTYVGRLLSAEEWRPFQYGLNELGHLRRKVASAKEQRDYEKLEKLEEQIGDTLLPLYRSYSHAIFARRWWEIGKRDPTNQIMRLPPVLMKDVFDDFFTCQRSAMGRPLENGRRPGGSASGRSSQPPGSDGPKRRRRRRKGAR